MGNKGNLKAIRPTQFGKAIYEHELLIEQVNFDYYKQLKRNIHHLFPRASKELDVVIVNFCHKPIIQVYAHGFTLNRKGLTKAINTLVSRGLISLFKDYSINGLPRIYQRTREFEKTFKTYNSRVKVNNSALSSSIRLHGYNRKANLAITNNHITRDNQDKKSQDKSNTREPTRQPTIPLLSGQKQIQKRGIWFGLRSNPYEQTKISLSNGEQVFEDVVLHRINGKRLYAQGLYNYQNGITREERHYILINGKPTVEPDFGALHGNMLLNRERQPSDKHFYERILRTFGLRNTKNSRYAIKMFFNSSLNIESRQAFSLLANRMTDDRDKSIRKEERPKLIGYLKNIRPIDVYNAIIETHPAISKYICAGNNSDWLQRTDSKIMMSTCKRLIRLGIIPLPIHDSCRVVTNKENVCIKTMKKAYKRIMGFDGIVKKG